MSNLEPNILELRAVLWLALMALGASGCYHRPALDVQRFSVDLKDVPIPVMLSDARVRDPGRAISAVGLDSKYDIEGGNGGYYREKQWSVLPPSLWLKLRIPKEQRFVQIRSIEFYALDYVMISATREVRKLEIEAEATQ